MSDEVTIYHNPRCSKSRQTLDLLQERGLQPEVIHYLDTPPTPTELELILEKLGMEPRELMRRGEAVYKELELDSAELSRDELIRTMVEHPILIERPIVRTADSAAIGRPPENVLAILP